MPIDEELLLKTCSLCGTKFPEWGNNPAPLADLEADGPCCDDCNSTKVIPARLSHIVPRASEMGEGLANGEFGMGKTGLVQEPPTDG